MTRIQVFYQIGAGSGTIFDVVDIPWAKDFSGFMAEIQSDNCPLFIWGHVLVSRQEGDGSLTRVIEKRIDALINVDMICRIQPCTWRFVEKGRL